ncbi:hypothetical protein [Neorhizobium petrolearium]|uniref:hypothetical protein n=1 Tax=Neorhizobium petrolearium TaxID=515361 RepID=UPI003F1471A6
MTPATILEHDGVRQSITEWALDYGITPAIIIARLERGMTMADAITMPMKVGFRGQRLPIFSNTQVAIAAPSRANLAKLYTFNGKTLTATEWAGIAGIKLKTFHSRLRKGWTFDLAITVPPGERLGRFAHGRPGVPSDFPPSKGTGAGSTAKETPKITFSGNDA